MMTFEVAPESRVVHVDNDPMVLTRARALLTSPPQGATAYVDADLRSLAGSWPPRRRHWICPGAAAGAENPDPDRNPPEKPLGRR
jgi:hypothetical protein